MRWKEEQRERGVSKVVVARELRVLYKVWQPHDTPICAAAAAAVGTATWLVELEARPSCVELPQEIESD